MTTTKDVIREVDELIAYLQTSLDAIQDQEARLRQVDRRERLEALKKSAVSLRDRMGGAVTSVEETAEDWKHALAETWQQAKHATADMAKTAWHKVKPGSSAEEETKAPPSSSEKDKETVMGSLKETVQDQWASLFESAEWQDFFARNTHLDVEGWKDFFRKQAKVQPHHWKDTIQEWWKHSVPKTMQQQWHKVTADRKVFGTLPSHNARPEEPAFIVVQRGSPQDWKPARPLLGGFGGQPEVVAPVGTVFAVFLLAYLAFLLRRILLFRRQTGVYTGDGSKELLMQAGNQPAAAPRTNLKQAMENNPKYHEITMLHRALHSLRTFTSWVPVTFLALWLAESQGLHHYTFLGVAHALNLGLAVLLNEWGTMSSSGLNAVVGTVTPLIPILPALGVVALLTRF